MLYFSLKFSSTKNTLLKSIISHCCNYMSVVVTIKVAFMQSNRHNVSSNAMFVQERANDENEMCRGKYTGLPSFYYAASSVESGQMYGKRLSV